ncbi:putative metal-binding membrane protein [Agromyces sp. 3263]|nr:putative metal-binding membrane protein [Agromyces sp. 3263]
MSGMTTTDSPTRAIPRAGAAWLAGRRPEERALLAVAMVAWVAWVTIALVSAGASGREVWFIGGHGHAVSDAAGLATPPGADADAGAGAAPALVGGLVGAAGLLSFLTMWTLMVAAMMLPTVLPAVRYVAQVSRPSRRTVMVATFTIAYLATWTALGSVIAALGWAIGELDLPAGAVPRTALVVAIIAAAVWELTASKRRALARCCRTSPIRLRGTAAYASAATFGLRNAAVCLVACGPAMAVLTLAGHPLVATVLVGALLIGEKVWRRGDRLRVWACAAGLLLAAAAVVA